MNSIWILLCIFALVAFALGWVIGNCKPHWCVWDWIDVAYYLLAALAVVMFFAADRNIRLEQIRSERERMNEIRLANPNPRPDVFFHPSAIESIRTSFNAFEVSVEYGESCKVAPSTECAERVQIGDAIARAFDGFSIPASDEPEQRARLEEDFCERSYRLLDSLDDSETLDADAYALLKAALVRQSKEHGDIAEAARRLGGDIQKAQDRLKAQIRATGSNADVAPIIIPHGEFAVYFFQMAGFCADRPTDQGKALDRLDAWQKESVRRSVEDRAFSRAEAEAAQKLQPTPVQKLGKSLKDGIWPFITILALALKFGKVFADRARKLPQRPEQPENEERDVAQAEVSAGASDEKLKAKAKPERPA